MISYCVIKLWGNSLSLYKSVYARSENIIRGTWTHVWKLSGLKFKQYKPCISRETIYFSSSCNGLNSNCIQKMFLNIKSWANFQTGRISGCTNSEKKPKYCNNKARKQIVYRVRFPSWLDWKLWGNSLSLYKSVYARSENIIRGTWTSCHTVLQIA